MVHQLLNRFSDLWVPWRLRTRPAPLSSATATWRPPAERWLPWVLLEAWLAAERRLLHVWRHLPRRRHLARLLLMVRRRRSKLLLQLRWQQVSEVPDRTKLAIARFCWSRERHYAATKPVLHLSRAEGALLGPGIVSIEPLVVGWTSLLLLLLLLLGRKLLVVLLVVLLLMRWRRLLVVVHVWRHLPRRPALHLQPPRWFSVVLGGSVPPCGVCRVRRRAQLRTHSTHSALTQCTH